MDHQEPITFRCLHDPPAGGPTSMARDEALLTTVGEGAAPPTLRFYQWSPPTNHALLPKGPNALYELMHDALLDWLKEGGVTARRDGASDGSGAARGPFFCFARRDRLDVLVGDDKLAA